MIQETPFIVDSWNLLIVFLSAFVRLFFALKNKSIFLGKKFSLVKYFDTRHLIRWFGHIFTALVLSLFVPEFVIDYLAPKYFPEFIEWSFIGDFIIGFLGYDLIKLAEKITSPIVEKFTGKLEK